MNYKKSFRRNERKRARIRSKIVGTAERPRLLVRKTNKYLYAQLIDDLNKKVISSLSSLDKTASSSGKSHKSKEYAKKLGLKVAETAKSKGISTVVFDRGIYVYHGKIKTFADTVRENGLKF